MTKDETPGGERPACTRCGNPADDVTDQTRSNGGGPWTAWVDPDGRSWTAPYCAACRRDPTTGTYRPKRRDPRTVSDVEDRPANVALNRTRTRKETR